MRTDRLLGYLTFAMLFVVAVVFYRERIAFTDLAYNMFALAVTEGEFQVHGYRFVSVLTQWLPVALIKGESPIWLVEVAYSLSFWLLYAAAWAVLHFGIRSSRWALAWALLWLCYSVHTQFYIPSELTQGLAVFVVCLGLVEWRATSYGWRFGKPLLVASGIFAVSFAHPVIVIPVTYCLLVVLLTDAAASRLRLACYAAIFYGGYWLRQTHFRTFYDAQVNNDWRPALDRLLDGDVPYSITAFARNVCWDYALFVFLVVASVATLWRARRRLLSVLTAGFVIGHLLLVALHYPTPVTTEFYIEHLYLPAGFVAAVGLSIGIGRSTRQAWVGQRVAIALGVAVALRLGYIGYVGETVYTPRLERLRAELDRYAGRKVVLRDGPAVTESLLMTWATPFEAWLVSAHKGEASAGYLVLPDPEAVRDHYGETGIFLAPTVAYPYDSLPAHYFGDPVPGVGYEFVE